MEKLHPHDTRTLNKPSDTARYPPFGKGGQGGFCFFIFLLLLFLTACQTQPRFKVEPLPRYDAAFERASGWTGGDGANSIALDDGRILWMFGDSLIGRVQDGRRIDSRLINNSAAIQTGREPAIAAMAFFYRTLADGSPAAFLKPADGAGWLWPYHGVRTAEGLFLFLLQIEPADGPAGFGFKLIATWLGKIVNPDEDPERWDLAQQKIPWGHEGRLFGSAVMVQGDICYIYGTMDDASSGVMVKHMIVARAPLEKLGHFSAWRFFADGDWVAEADRAGRVCDHVASEFSVSYLPELGRYALVYTEGGLSPNIVLRFSPRPEGPWGDPVRVYSCPEAGWDPRIFCYAAKGHPELGVAADELIVTYMANATDFALLESDARLYRPRFLKITFDGAQPGEGSGPKVHGSTVQRFTVGEK
jgi:hypothetical protein